MRAIIWKELRENTKWAALMLVGMLIAVTVVLIAEFERYIRDGAFASVLLAMAFGSCAAALILGFLQTAFDTRRDQWAFLMHRGVSASRVFLGKTVTGIGLYLVAMLPSLALAAVWCSWRGVERYPFDWRMLVPSLAVILASVGLYFGAMLVALRQARWYGSRLLPLVLPGLTVFLVALTVVEGDELVPFSLILLILCGVAAMGIAAWGVFVKSGESTDVAALPRVCLGAMLTVAFVIAFGFISITVTSFARAMGWGSTIYGPFSEYRVNSRGHVVLFEHGGAPRRRSLTREVLRVTDLDQPSSKKYDGLVGQQLFGQFHNPNAEVTDEWDGLPMTDLNYAPRTWLRAGRRQLLEFAGFEADWAWLISRLDRVIYVYRQAHWDEKKQRFVPPSLKWIVGPDGFRSPSEPPSRCFGRPLAITSGWQQWSTRAWWPGKSGGDGRRTWERRFLLFDDGLYEIDPVEQSIRQHYAAPEGKRIRSIAPVHENRFAIVFEDSVHIHEASTIVAGKREDYETHAKTDLRIALPGKWLHSIPIPEEARCFDSFAFGELANPDMVVFSCTSFSDIQRFVCVRRDGTVVRSQDLPRDAGYGPPPGAKVGSYVEAAFIPFAFTAVMSLADAIPQTLNGMGPGRTVRSLLRDPLAVLPPLAVMILVSVLSGWIARRIARRYGFSKRETTWSVAVAVSLGLAGLLLLLCLREWPARQPCHICGKLRPVDKDSCTQCGTTLAPPPTDGTEILEPNPAMSA